MRILITLFALTVCLPSLACPIPKAVLLDSLWTSGANKKQVVYWLYGKYSEVDNWVISQRDSWGEPHSEHLFVGDQLVEQFIILNKYAFNDFITHNTCEWAQDKKLESLSGVVYLVERGHCEKKDIWYKVIPDQHHYEIRWKRD